MRAVIAAAALAAALAGCRDDRAPSPTIEPDIPATPLTASINGVPFPIATALATSWGGRAVELHFATLPITCADALGNGYSPRPGEQRFHVTIAPVASEGGAWHVVYAGALALNKAAKMERAIVTAADARPGRHTTARIRVDAEWSWPGDPTEHLVAAGAVDVIGCGVRKIHDAKARPQPVGFQVGPMRVPVNGATLVRRDDGDLELSLGNAPFDCDGNVPMGDARLGLVMHEGSWIVNHVGLRGDLLGDQLTATPTPRTGEFTVKPIEGEGPNAELEVTGTMSMHGVPTTIGGRVSALRCAR